jgi:hypothetical protein
MAISGAAQPEFIAEWNDSERGRRRRVRQFARLGRLPEDASDAALAVGYAQYQLTRVQHRTFWFWLVPSVIVLAGLVSTIHPVLVGIVIGLGVYAVYVHRNFNRLGAAG